MLNKRLITHIVLSEMKRSFQESQARLFETAQSQGGYFTAKQAEDAGFTRTNHAYHVENQNWQREYRGIFRLTRFPLPEHPDLILWTLWSRDRKDHPQGVISHQTALAVWDLSDLMPATLHMTVPVGFRRSAIPDALVLHYADLDPDRVEEREGYRVTRPMLTILDLIESNEVSDDIIEQAFTEARQRGLITEAEIEENREKLPPALVQRSAIAI